MGIMKHNGFVTDEEEDMEFSDKKQKETHSKKDESIEENFLDDENSEHDDFPEEDGDISDLSGILDEDWNEDDEEHNEETTREETRMKNNKKKIKGGDIEDSFLSDGHLENEEKKPKSESTEILKTTGEDKTCSRTTDCGP